VENKVYEVDVSESVVEWIGRNITGSHYGTVNILNGTIPVRRSLPHGGSFLIDMDSIRNLDIQNTTLNRVLVDHLKSDDFFDVKKFPTSRFDIILAQPVDGVKPGAVNYQMKGKLTMKNITQEVAFNAVVSLREDLAVVAETHFDIDRTLWSVNYGSGKFFEKLGRHLVYDNITLQLKLVAK
jgi:polyisoprenoid-binding protein YceI